MIKAAFSSPVFILCVLAGISVAALAFALTGQYGFGLHPCVLCIYQRIPYGIVIGLAVIGTVLTNKAGDKAGAAVIALCGLAFLANAGIAFYHVGVEEKWWASAACSVPDLSNLSFEELQRRIQEAPSVSCDAIAWQMLGISMAGYNVILCGLLGIYALAASVTVTRKANGL